MYAGEIVEEAPVDVLFYQPAHPYTKGLIASVPKLGSGVKVLPSIPGSVPDLSSLPEGCRFAPRCAFATERCRKTIARNAAFRVDFITNGRELHLYTTVIYSAMMWGWGKRIEEKEKEALQNDKLMK